jgi:hypothetical protein
MTCLCDFLLKAATSILEDESVATLGFPQGLASVLVRGAVSLQKAAVLYSASENFVPEFGNPHCYAAAMIDASFADSVENLRIDLANHLLDGARAIGAILQATLTTVRARMWLDEIYDSADAHRIVDELLEILNLTKGYCTGDTLVESDLIASKIEKLGYEHFDFDHLVEVGILRRTGPDGRTACYDLAYDARLAAQSDS